MIYDQGSTRCIVEKPEEFDEKSKEFIPKMIKLCAWTHENASVYNTHQEGVFNFWMTVDNAIVVNLNKVELNNLKSFRANAQTV